MNSELYAIIALAARYLFCGLMVLIVFRAWRITVVDNRRAKILRAWTPETGSIGEFMLNPGKSKRRQSVLVPKEGVLGSGRSADVRVKYADVARAHAYLEQREGGLLVRPLGGARVEFEGGMSGEQMLLRDGDVIVIGKLKMMLVLFDASSGEADAKPTPPRRASVPTPKKIQTSEYDDFFDEDDVWPEEIGRKKSDRKR